MTLTAHDLAMNLSDMLWSGYASYVLAHCPRPGDGWELDVMAAELLAAAVDSDAGI